MAGPAGLAADLRSVTDTLESGRYQVFSPGDECPDNNLVTPDGVRFIDYESAGFHSVFLDAAYLRMPFSTCWCVFRPPAGLADLMTGLLAATQHWQVTELPPYPALGD